MALTDPTRQQVLQLMATTSGTKLINSCNKPIRFFYLLYSKQLWNLIATNTNKCARDQNRSHWKDVNVKTMKGFMAIIFNMSLIKKWNKWLLVSQKLYEHTLVFISNGSWPIQKNSSRISYCWQFNYSIKRWPSLQTRVEVETITWLHKYCVHALLYTRLSNCHWWELDCW